MKNISGGCLCGQVRYQSESEVLRAYHCHCRDCQKLSGTGHMSLMVIAADKFDLAGELKFFEKTGDSGNTVSLGFCPNCGSNILGKPHRLAGVIAIAAGSLDDTSLFNPTMNIFTDSAPHWDSVSNETKKFSGVPK